MAQVYHSLIAGPAERDLALGPLISAPQKSRVEAFIRAGLGRGAELVAAGQVAEDAPEGGHYVAPQLYAGVTPDDALAQEEIFGPVQILLPFEDEDEAVALANGTRFGLVAGVWTKDAARQHRLVRRLHAGQGFQIGRAHV